MKTYDVVNVQFTHSSFSWANGLYAVIEIKGEEMRMCAISGGKAAKYTDGSFQITCTSTNNKEVYTTDLKLIV